MTSPPAPERAGGYTIFQVIRLTELDYEQVEAYVQAEFVSPRQVDGTILFSFQDLLLLRTARRLSNDAPARRVVDALARLRRQLPRERALTELAIEFNGREIIARESGTTWHPESGQIELDFYGQSPEVLPTPVSPLELPQSYGAPDQDPDVMDASVWFELGDELEDIAVDEARDAYRHALELDPSHIEARVNLARLLHEGGYVSIALAHYELAHKMCPQDPTPAFNLGVALQDLGRLADALVAYQSAIDAEPKFADAYYNASRLCELLDREHEALEYLKCYRSLRTDC